MRAAIIVVLTLISTGCAYLPTGISQVQLTARDGGAVYYGSVRREGLALVSMTVDVDRRIYLGNVELTSANSTFGLSQRYGAREAAPVTGAILARTNFTKAILSSTDNRLMKCDFTDVAGTNAGGLCVDEAQRVYDVIFS
jgi:hypothetical protein